MRMVDFTVHDEKVVMTRKVLAIEQFRDERAKELASKHFLTGLTGMFTPIFAPMRKEIDPHNTSRAKAYALWMRAPNPVVTFIKSPDVTNLVKVSRRRHWKIHMLPDYCIGKASAPIREFYLLPAGEKLLPYDALAGPFPENLQNAVNCL